MKRHQYLVVLFFFVFLLGACCPYKSVSREERKEQVAKNISNLKGINPFYWLNGSKQSLEPRESEKEWLLCAFLATVPQEQIPNTWTKLGVSAHSPLYTPKDYESSNVNYYWAIVPKGEQAPQGAKELYRGGLYYDVLGEQLVWDNDLLMVKPADGFKDVAELADMLDLVVERWEQGWYILSVRHSSRRAWQVAHILTQDRAISEAKPYFTAYKPLVE